MSQIIPNDTSQFPVQPGLAMANIVAPVTNGIVSVNEWLLEELNNCDSILQERLKHSGLTSGKRVRPVLLLLSGGCFGDVKKTHVAAATALEFVHAATLLHDDVLDGAGARRHDQSMHVRWDNQTSILAGDFLFSKAFEIACQAGNLEVVREVAKASSNVCHGEIRQNATAGQFEMSEKEYFEIISLKTAELCRSACGLGALLSECNESIVAQFENFGSDLGVAFQVIDDVLDLVGNEQKVGKTLGTDLKNQKPTLPVIHYLNHVGDAEAHRFVTEVSSGKWQFDDVVARLKDSGSIEYSRSQARTCAQRAASFAGSLSESDYSRALVSLAEFVIERTY